MAQPPLPLPLLALLSLANWQVVRTLSRTDRQQPHKEPGSPFVTPSYFAVGITWMDRMMYHKERENKPYIQDLRPWRVNTSGISAHLSESRYVPMSAAEPAKLSGLGVPGTEPELNAILGIERKKSLDLIRTYPHPVLSRTGPVEWLTVLADRQVIARDLSNLPKSGRTWSGVTYDLIATCGYGFTVPCLIEDEPTCLTIHLPSPTVGTGNTSRRNMTVGPMPVFKSIAL